MGDNAPKTSFGAAIAVQSAGRFQCSAATGWTDRTVVKNRSSY